MSQTLHLYRLQQIDSQIDRTQARLQVIQETLENDAELRLANEQAETAQACCRSAEKALKEAEARVKDQHIQIEQNESSLYGGKAHTPKELQDLQNEVAALKRYLAALEDRQLEGMLAVEEAEARLQSAQASLEAARERWVEQNKLLVEEQTSLKNQIGRFATERGVIAEAIPAAEFSLYDQLRKQRRGVAVAAVSENSCSACGSSLSAAHVQSARSSERVVTCPSCGRILYSN